MALVGVSMKFSSQNGLQWLQTFENNCILYTYIKYQKKENKILLEFKKVVIRLKYFQSPGKIDS